MKKHNTLKVVLITLCAFLVCSWIFTSAYYSGGYVDQGRVQMGLFDIFSYPTFKAISLIVSGVLFNRKQAWFNLLSSSIFLNQFL